MVEYLARGFALARIRPNEKRPTDSKWTVRGRRPDEFQPGDNLGLMTGALSGNLVCVDVDSAAALLLADRCLPPTKMLGGRAGKPRSHRYYRVTDLDPELTAPPSVAGGIGGPRTRRFRGPEGMILEMLGTGSQAVEAPSIWVGADGARREPRLWHEFEEPAEVPHRELYDAVVALARECGYQERRPKVRERAARQVPSLQPIPPGEAARQARSYLAQVPAAIEGQGGDARTFFVACLLIRDFGLSGEEAWPLFLEYNARCQPPWGVPELVHKLKCADEYEGPRGGRLRRTGRRIEVCVRTDCDAIMVGLDCRGEGGSYVLLEPGLWAGFVRLGKKKQELAVELAEVDWRGKEVILTPASTIATNTREVWDEFWLAYLLRQRGARVRSLRLPPLDGRRRTFSQADGTEQEVAPPWTARKAFAAAQEASRKAEEGERAWRALPRRKGSPKLAQAVEWLEERGARRLSADVVESATEAGISKGTLRRAMKVVSGSLDCPAGGSCKPLSLPP
jgi:hypothetical protein